MICILNYGTGNLRSIQRSVEYFYKKVEISKSKTKIKEAKGLILPGVGAFGDAVNELKNANLFNFLKETIPKKLTFGICLGMQLMFSWSAESPNYEGLKLIDGKVVKLKSEEGRVKIPHTGWNRLIPVKEPEFQGYVHFNHSYYCKPREKDIIVSRVLHGDFIPSIIKKNTFFGTQFHPEKSGEIGLKIIKWFVNQVEDS
ncbi:MAG: Imidazole glycerol phosphate synthase subunit HisH [Promethearchaeota archaeon]|nr:MAG: Imidazole glycerol phosphate synthase subunit HisH [Candidatus Lokiarchaeota archaeon]